MHVYIFRILETGECGKRQLFTTYGYRCGFEPCETSQTLLADSQVGFSGALLFKFAYLDE